MVLNDNACWLLDGNDIIDVVDTIWLSNVKHVFITKIDPLQMLGLSPRIIKDPSHGAEAMVHAV